MTHCISCDTVLSDFEATRKHAETNEYLDLCNKCLKEILAIQHFNFLVNPNNSHLPSNDDDDIIQEQAMPSMPIKW